jgi:hypothetical protein
MVIAYVLGTMLMIIFAILGVFISTQADLAAAPPVDQVHKAALEYAHIDNAEPRRWRKQVKYSAVLPKLQLGFSHRVKNLVDININDNVYVGASGIVVGPDESDYQQSSDLYETFTIKAVWALDRSLSR